MKKITLTTLLAFALVAVAYSAPIKESDWDWSQNVFSYEDSTAVSNDLTTEYTNLFLYNLNRFKSNEWASVSYTVVIDNALFIAANGNYYCNVSPFGLRVNLGYQIHKDYISIMNGYNQINTFAFTVGSTGTTEFVFNFEVNNDGVYTNVLLNDKQIGEYSSRVVLPISRLR